MTKKQEIDTVIYTGLIYGFLLFFSIFDKTKTIKDKIFYGVTGLLIISLSISNAVMQPKSIINDDFMYISMITIYFIAYFMLLFIGLGAITLKNFLLSSILLIVLISIVFFREYLKKIKEKEKDDVIVGLISIINFVVFAIPGIILCIYVFARERYINKSIRYFLNNKLLSKCLGEPEPASNRLDFLIVFVIIIYFTISLIVSLKDLKDLTENS